MMLAKVYGLVLAKWKGFGHFGASLPDLPNGA